MHYVKNDDICISQTKKQSKNRILTILNIYKMKLYQTRRFTIYCDGSDLTFEYRSSGESFTLYCTLDCDVNTGIINKMIVDDYDGCFDFNRDHVTQAMKLYNENIVIDFSEL